MVKDKEAWHVSIRGVSESDTTEVTEQEQEQTPVTGSLSSFAEHFTTECLSLMSQNSVKEMQRWDQVWRDSLPTETLP